MMVKDKLKEKWKNWILRSPDNMRFLDTSILIDEVREELAKELINKLMYKSPMGETDKYFTELKKSGKDKFFYSDFVMFIRDNFIKEELEEYI